MSVASRREDGLVVEATGLTKTYRWGEVELQALRGVDFALHESELVQCGRQDGLEAQVLSGLQADQAVVAHPGDAVADGACVSPHPSL